MQIYQLQHHPYCWLEWNTFQRVQRSMFCLVASLKKSRCKLVTLSHKALQTARASQATTLPLTQGLF